METITNHCERLDKIFEKVEDNPESTSNYTIKNSRLLHPTTIGEEGESLWKLCIPRYYRVVIRENHAVPTTDHVSIRKIVKTHFLPLLQARKISIANKIRFRV